MPGGHSKGLARRILLYGRQVRQANYLCRVLVSPGKALAELRRAQGAGVDLFEVLVGRHVAPFFRSFLRCCSMVSISNCFSLSRSSFGGGCSPLARASASNDSSRASSSSSES